MTLQTPLRIGTRGSKLALIQAEEVRARLSRAHGLSEADAVEVALRMATPNRPAL